MLRLNLTKKFFIAGLVMISVFIVSIGIAIIAAKDINDTFKGVIQNEHALLFHLSRLHSFGLQCSSSTRQIIIAPDKVAAETYEKAHKSFIKTIDDASKVAPPEIAKEIEGFLSEWNAVHMLRTNIQKLSLEGKKNEAIALLATEVVDWRKLREKISEMINVQQTKTTAKQKQAEDLTKNRIYLAAVIAIFALIVSWGFFYMLIIRQIKYPLRDLTMVAKAVGKGDLSKKILWSRSDEMGEMGKTLNDTIERLKKLIQSDEERSKAQENIVNFLNLLSSASEGDLSAKAEVTPDIFGSLGDAFNLMIEGLTDLIEKVRIASENVNRESRKILGVLQSIENGSEKQSLEVRNARQSVEAAANSATAITEKANQARKISETVVLAVSKGNQLVLESTEGIQLIRVTVQSINKRMKYLSERLIEIGTISQVITEIAQKTDLLAINASIEAARAGEQGKGFVVIAEEIRGLAEKAAKSTKQIGDIISTIQVESAGVTKYLEEETSYVEMETKLAADTGNAFKDIDSSIKDTVSVISDIHSSANAQRELTSRVAISMEEVQRITREMLNLVKEVSKISGLLSGTSTALMSSVERFKLPEAEEAEVKTISD